MTSLEPTLSKIPNAVERLRAVAKRRLRLKKNFLYIFWFARGHFSFKKEKKILLSAFCSERAGGDVLMSALGRGGKKKGCGENEFPPRFCFSPYEISRDK